MNLQYTRTIEGESGQLLPSDYIVDVRANNPITIYLPSISRLLEVFYKSGRGNSPIFTLTDTLGLAGTNNITLVADVVAGDTIFGQQTYTINQNNASVNIMPVANGQWGIVSSLGKVDTDSVPIMPTTYSELFNLVNTNSLQVGVIYSFPHQIYDTVYLQSLGTNKLSPLGNINKWTLEFSEVYDLWDYERSQSTSFTKPNAGQVWGYNNMAYQSLVDNNAAVPSNDGVNWTLIPPSIVSGYYSFRMYDCKFDMKNDWLSMMEDTFGNKFEISYDYWHTSGVAEFSAYNPIYLFRWGYQDSETQPYNIGNNIRESLVVNCNSYENFNHNTFVKSQFYNVDYYGNTSANNFVDSKMYNVRYTNDFESNNIIGESNIIFISTGFDYFGYNQLVSTNLGYFNTNNEYTFSAEFYLNKFKDTTINFIEGNNGGQINRFEISECNFDRLYLQSITLNGGADFFMYYCNSLAGFSYLYSMNLYGNGALSFISTNLNNVQFYDINATTQFNILYQFSECSLNGRFTMQQGITHTFPKSITWVNCNLMQTKSPIYSFYSIENPIFLDAFKQAVPDEEGDSYMIISNRYADLWRSNFRFYVDMDDTQVFNAGLLNLNYKLSNVIGEAYLLNFSGKLITQFSCQLFDFQDSREVVITPVGENPIGVDVQAVSIVSPTGSYSIVGTPATYTLKANGTLNGRITLKQYRVAGSYSFRAGVESVQTWE